MTAGLGKKGCDRLPKTLRKGCEITFDYIGDNPKVKKFYRVACPKEITEKTGCRRQDDAELGASPAPPGGGEGGGGGSDDDNDPKSRRRGPGPRTRRRSPDPPTRRRSPNPPAERRRSKPRR